MENNNSIEPIILGTLRKEKSSKPLFVLIVLIILLGITFSLPYLEEYVTNPNTIVGKIYNSIFIVEKKDDDEIIIPNDSMHILNDKTDINYKTIVLTNVSLDNKTIIYNIKAKNGTVNLDDGNYYLEVYGSSNNLLDIIKLTGTLTTTDIEKSYTFIDLKFNPASNYYGKIKELKEEEYNEISLNSDESGIASLTCIAQNDSYEYIFDNYKLKSIKHYFEYNDTSQIDIYLNKYQEYSNKSEIINKIKSGSSKTEETNEGLRFTANLDLNIINKKDLGAADYIYYYNLDKPAKIISYDMKAQGFTCQ